MERLNRIFWVGPVFSQEKEGGRPQCLSLRNSQHHLYTVVPDFSLGFIFSPILSPDIRGDPYPFCHWWACSLAHPSCRALSFWPTDWLKDEHVTQVGPIRVKSRTCPGVTWKRMFLFSAGCELGKVWGQSLSALQSTQQKYKMDRAGDVV